MKSFANMKQIQSNVLIAEAELLQIIDSLPLSINLAERIKFSSIMRSCIVSNEAKQLLEKIKKYDYKTYIHSLSVCVYSLGIGQYGGLTEGKLQELALASIFHDIGKTSLPTLLLNKAGKFTEVERAEMNKHPFYGYDMLKESTFPSFVADVAYEHHERIDGSGYPRGLSSKEIHDYAKIVAIGDVFDALTSERPYKDAMSIKEALELMKSAIGTQFDIEMMKSFYAFIEENR